MSVDLSPERKGRKFFYSEYYTTDARFVINNLILEEDEFWLLGTRCLPNQTPTLAFLVCLSCLSPCCGTRKASFSSPRCDRTRGCGGKKPEFPAAAQVVRFNLQVNFTCTNLLTLGRSEFSGVRAHGHEVRVILL